MDISSQNNFSVVSTFSGCGGSSLGYRLAGGKVLLAIEWDDNAVETYRLNFPNIPIYHGNICKLSIEECCNMAGIKAGELDVFDGSPPCQGFSVAGKREFGDDRNQLFREYIRLLRGLQPKVFVMENVSGMIKGKMKLIFRDCLSEMKKSGYKVKARLLNAKWYNVAQSRQRLIFIGVREDLGIEPSYPKGKGPVITVRKAWEGVTNSDEEIKEATLKDSFAVAKVAKYLKPGQSCKNKYFNLVRCAWNKPSPTIAKVHGERLSMAGLMHPTEMRRPTIKELKRLGSFPDTFQFVGNFGERWACIGNAVPPNFMKAIAEHIRDNILR